MYYLVRDYYDKTKKKIFSDKYDIEECMDEYEDKPMLLVYSWVEGMYNDVRNGKRIYFDQYYILKKSENVCDFIEVGDLVRFSSEFMIGFVEEINLINYGLKALNFGINKEYKLSAIYKPNKNGDYIKVWERVNENDR